MTLLGLVLILAGAALGVLAVAATSGHAGTITVSALGFSREAHALELVIVGAAATLLVCLGWALVSAAMRRRARVRREDRERERVAELEQAAEDERVEHERRMAEAGASQEALTRRAAELDERHGALDAREQELARREAEWRDREGPSVADVVTGRAQGSVTEGTAQWSEGSTTTSEPTVAPNGPGQTGGRPVHRPERRFRA
ncbi:hypothetical protein N865_05555 [Intrasporangium oryzae NRRL B-24470]|uniref:Lipopolysaccharide assembly protein A domain-containing protein n=1 Tax=Intrasporangium oryzae NRRL B-24470 TaxID=1386089 RepID=W9G8W8_9MICO|nr:hypothetical protein [Intrasporangium oryzae]EWT01273.1 hypothetical protein N865_05555 [Intrasporangium oryzae NRRL B-24470]